MGCSLGCTPDLTSKPAQTCHSASQAPVSCEQHCTEASAIHSPSKPCACLQGVDNRTLETPARA
eukprot:1450544-Amphidinium_carterae.2